MASRYESARVQLTEEWGKFYPRPIAELLAVITSPFDDAAESTAVRSAHKLSKRAVKELFQGKRRPSGGEIEGPLTEIANSLRAELEADGTSPLAVQRLQMTVGQLGNTTKKPAGAEVDDLIVPEEARKLDGEVPFAMWR